MSPYQEAETFPRGARVALVPLAALILIGPYGLMIGGGPSDVIPWILTALAVGFGALVAGIGIAQPRQSVTVNGDDHTVTFSRTARPPRIQPDRWVYPFSEILSVELREVGVSAKPSHGWRVVLTRTGDREPLLLKRQRDRDDAQDVVDHLVRLGLPGVSRSAQRAAQLDAQPEPKWL